MSKLTFDHRMMECHISKPEPCKQHRKYTAQRQPRANCRQCWRIFEWVRRWGKRINGKWLVPA